MGRVDSPMPHGSRCAKLLADGATMTYDVFQPLGNLKTGGLQILYRYIGSVGDDMRNYNNISI